MELVGIAGGAVGVTHAEQQGIGEDLQRLGAGVTGPVIQQSLPLDAGCGGQRGQEGVSLLQSVVNAVHHQLVGAEAGLHQLPDFSGKKVAGVAKGSTGSITLYAKWEKVPENSQTRTGESDEEVGTADAEKTKTDNPDKTVNTKTTKTDNATITADIPTTGGEEKAESSSIKNPNTGNNANQGGFLEGDFYLGALSIGIFGFVIYLIKSRRKVKTRTRKIMKF